MTNWEFITRASFLFFFRVDSTFFFHHANPFPSRHKTNDNLYPSTRPPNSSSIFPRPKLRYSICIYHQTIVIVNYNYYYKRLHEIINSDKMSEKNHNLRLYLLFCAQLSKKKKKKCVETIFHREVSLYSKNWINTFC